MIFGVLILKKFMLNQNSSNNTKATELHQVTFQKTDKMANLLILHELEWDTFLDHI